VYKIDRRVTGVADARVLEKAFQKLLLNFTWWVNRKDTEGKNVFEGGFLGLDNIGVFDRSAPLPTGGHIEQSDGTSWMGMYCLNMPRHQRWSCRRPNPAYEDIASKFFEHFVYIAKAMHDRGGEESALGRGGRLYYESATDREVRRLKVRSDGRADPALAVDARAGGRRAAAGLTRTHAVVHRQPARVPREPSTWSRAPAGGVRRLLSMPIHEVPSDCSNVSAVGSGAERSKRRCCRGRGSRPRRRSCPRCPCGSPTT